MQPAGEVHITSAKGEYKLAYIKIDNGPYLVRLQRIRLTREKDQLMLTDQT